MYPIIEGICQEKIRIRNYPKFKDEQYYLEKKLLQLKEDIKKQKI